MSKKTSNPSFLLGCLLGAVVLALITAFSLISKTLNSQPQDMKELPPDIRKQFGKVLLSSKYKVTILLYHYVENIKDPKDTIRQSLNIPPHIFEAQVKTLKEAGFTFMTTRELSDVVDGKLELPSKPVILT